MIRLTRQTDCPKGQKGSISILGGFVRSSNTRVFNDGLASALGIPAEEMTVDFDARTVTWNGVVVATMTQSGTPA